MKLMPTMPWGLEEMLSKFGLISDRRIGVAFGGGGARGFFHIGVLMAMEKFGIKPDVISGVSAGAIAAVLYGAGLSPREMMACFADYDKFGDFTAITMPRGGVFKLDKFAKLLQSWLPVTHLEDMKIPTVVCAADIDQGRSVGWAKGEIVPRVVASCSLPVVFKPTRIDGRYYVDGGVLRNLPAWAIRKNCTTLIGSNCSPLDRIFKYTPKSSLIDVALRSYALMTKANVLQDLQLCDYVVMSQSMARYKTFGIREMKRIVKEGYECGCLVFDKMNI